MLREQIPHARRAVGRLVDLERRYQELTGESFAEESGGTTEEPKA